LTVTRADCQQRYLVIEARVNNGFDIGGRRDERARNAGGGTAFYRYARDTRLINPRVCTDLSRYARPAWDTRENVGMLYRERTVNLQVRGRRFADLIKKQAARTKVMNESKELFLHGVSLAKTITESIQARML